MYIEEDLVGAGVDAVSVGLGHDLVKRFVNNIWAGEDISDDNLSANPEELEADGPVDYSDGQNEDIWDSEDVGDRAQGSKETTERPAAETRVAGNIDPSVIDSHNVDVGWDSEYHIRWDQVVNNTEKIKSRRVFAYKEI